MKMERKTYIVPQCDIVEIAFSGIIAASLGVEDDNQTSEGDGDFTEDAGAARGDWNNIWDGM